MRVSLISTVLLTALLVGPTLVHGETLSGSQLVAHLRQGGYVILMRHASSPREPPAAEQADAENQARERQLDETGRASARAMGEALRKLRIPVGKVLSSPTYRALQTVRLAGLGAPQTFTELGDEGHSMQADPGGVRGKWLRERVATPPARQTNTVIITHLPNIHEAFPEYATGIEDGEALVFHPDGQGNVVLVGRAKITEWPQLSGLP
jgi:phosphohistidine phosphatase SixA